MLLFFPNNEILLGHLCIALEPSITFLNNYLALTAQCKTVQWKQWSHLKGGRWEKFLKGRGDSVGKGGGGAVNLGILYIYICVCVCVNIYICVICVYV